MKIVYVTSGLNGLYGLRHLASAGFDIEAVVTIQPEVAVKNTVSGYADVSSVARELGIRVISLQDYILRPQDLEGLRKDILVVNGWNRLIKKDVLAAFKFGGLGIHAGHPPLGLGRAPLPWNLIKGFEDIEVYVFRLTERADDGNILAKRTLQITPWDDVNLLYQKVMYWGARLFAEALAKPESPGAAQNLALAEKYPKRTPEDGKIDWALSVRQLHDFVRAQTRPYPGAFTTVRGETLKIWKAVPFDDFAFRDTDRHPGRVVAVLPAGLVVQTGSGPLWVLEAETSAGRVDTARFGAEKEWLGAILGG